jgi:hypothetical protein
MSTQAWPGAHEALLVQGGIELMEQRPGFVMHKGLPSVLLAQKQLTVALHETEPVSGHSEVVVVGQILLGKHNPDWQA